MKFVCILKMHFQKHAFAHCDLLRQEVLIDYCNDNTHNFGNKSQNFQEFAATSLNINIRLNLGVQLEFV